MSALRKPLIVLILSLLAALSVYGANSAVQTGTPEASPSASPVATPVGTPIG